MRIYGYVIISNGQSATLDKQNRCNVAHVSSFLVSRPARRRRCRHQLVVQKQSFIDPAPPFIVHSEYGRIRRMEQGVRLPRSSCSLAALPALAHGETHKSS